MKSKRRDLENKLWSIQELKRQHYIGTQDAWNYLKEGDIIERRPGEICDQIIQRAKLQSTDYLPTPQRLNGLLEAFDLSSSDEGIEEEVFGVGSKEDDDTSKVSNYIDFITNPKDLLTAIYFDSHMGGRHLFTDKEGSSKEFVKTLATLFSQANRGGVRTDGDMGEFVTGHLKYCIEKRLETPELAEYVPEMVRHLIPFYSGFDWSSAFSRERFDESKRMERLGAFVENVDIVTLANRLITDRYGKFLDYRRQLIATLLQQQDFSSYGAVVGFIDEERQRTAKSIPVAEKRKNRLIESEAPEALLIHADRLLKMKRRALESYKFLREAVGREKNYVEKLLRS